MVAPGVTAAMAVLGPLPGLPNLKEPHPLPQGGKSRGDPQEVTHTQARLAGETCHHDFIPVIPLSLAEPRAAMDRAVCRWPQAQQQAGILKAA